LIVFLIAALPAAFVVAVSTTGSRAATLAAAVVAASFGAIVGNPVYALLDVGAVAIALYLFWPEQSAEKIAEREAKKAYWESPQGKAEEKGYAHIATVIVGLACATYLYFEIKPFRDIAPPVVVALAYQAPWPAAIQPVAAPAPRPTSSALHPVTRPKRKPPLQKCLEIREEKTMMDCLQKLE
jgi:hypothetical protein